MKLECDIISVLKILDTYFLSKRLIYTLIGGRVPQLLIADPVSDTHRPTLDIDVALHLQNWHDYNNVKKELLNMGFREDNFELRFVYEKTILDIVPYLPKEMKSGILRLPHSKNSMNLSGFDRLFTNAVQIAIETDFTIPVVPLPLFVFTKILAFLDRGVSQNIFKDLHDIIFVMENYESDKQSERWFDKIIPLTINYQNRGAYLIGTDLKRYLNQSEINLVINFCSYFDNEYSPYLQQLARYESQKRKELAALFDCFKKGIQS